MALFNKGDYDQQVPNTNRENNEEILEFNPASTEEERLNVKLNQMKGELDSLYAQVGKDYYDANIDTPQDGDMSSLFRDIADKKGEVENLTGQLRTLKGITTCKHCGADILVTDTFCSNCGERNISEVTIAPAGGKCPNCGHQVSPGQQFCTTCGAKVNVSESAAAPEETAPEKPVTEEPAAHAPEMEDTDFEKTMVWSPATDESPAEASAAKESAAEEPAAEEPAAEEPAAQEPAASGAPQSEPNEPAAFCTNCGSPLEPGDVFCINCGHKVGE